MGTPQGLGIASSMHAPGLAEPSHPGTPLQEMHPLQLPTQDDIINNLVRSLCQEWYPVIVFFCFLLSCVQFNSLLRFTVLGNY